MQDIVRIVEVLEKIDLLPGREGEVRWTLLGLQKLRLIGKKARKRSNHVRNYGRWSVFNIEEWKEKGGKGRLSLQKNREAGKCDKNNITEIKKKCRYRKGKDTRRIKKIGVWENNGGSKKNYKVKIWKKVMEKNRLLARNNRKAGKSKRNTWQVKKAEAEQRIEYVKEKKRPKKNLKWNWKGRYDGSSVSPSNEIQVHH